MTNKEEMWLGAVKALGCDIFYAPLDSEGCIDEGYNDTWVNHTIYDPKHEMWANGYMIVAIKAESYWGAFNPNMPPEDDAWVIHVHPMNEWGFKRLMEECT